MTPYNPSIASLCRILFLALLSYTPGTLAAQPQPGPSSEATGAPTPQQMRADLETFRTGFLALDRSYTPAARAEAEALLAHLEHTLETLSRAQFELRLAQIVALADNGHTISFAGHRSDHFNRVPIRLTPFGDAFYVLRATPPHADLLGARLLAIDHRPMDQIRDTARTLSGGIAAWQDRFANFFIESPEQLHALGLANAPEGALYTLVTPEGVHLTRYLPGDPPGHPRPAAGPIWPDGPRRFIFPDAKRWMYPALMESEVGTWLSLQPNGEVPWALQHPEETFRARDVPDHDATVIELRKNTNAPGQRIQDALPNLQAQIEAHDRTHLIVDMRANGGGDLTTTRDFMKQLPEQVPGQIAVLISPWTFSAGISSVGYLKQAAPDRVTIIGEGPGDRLEFFAEGPILKLPHTDVMLLYATERHDYRNGCQGKTDCHGNVVRHPIAVPSLAPEVFAPWTFEAFVAGRDPAMEAAFARLQYE